MIDIQIKYAQKRINRLPIRAEFFRGNSNINE